MLTDTYTAIAPGSVPGFLAGQAMGAAAAALLVGWLFAPSPEQAVEVVVPHERSRDPGTAAGAPAAGNDGHHPGDPAPQPPGPAAGAREGT